MDIYEKLKELGIELPAPLPAAGLYKPVVQSGNLIYVSGQGSFDMEGKPMTGKLGRDLSIEEGQAAARMCALNALAAIDKNVGLDKVKKLVKTLGFINSAEGFGSAPAVLNGASQVIADIFGPEDGVAARTAMGTNEVPLNLAVEVEFIFELK